MSIIFGLLISVASISTALLFAVAMNSHWKDKESSKSAWTPVVILFAVSGILLINRTLVIEGATINDAFLILLMLVSIAMFISIACSRFYNIKYKEKGKFKKISRNTFILAIILLLLFIVTVPGTNIEEGAAAKTESATVKTAQTIAEDNETYLASEEEAAEEERLAAEKKEQEEAEEEAKEKEEKEKLAAEKKAEQEAKEKKEKEKLAAEKEAEEEAKEKKEKEKLAAEKKAEEEAKEKKAEEEAKKSKPAVDGLQAVELYRVVDGDTVHVLNSNNETLKLRLLLIDTPETVHPNKPVEAFGPEASARMTELVTAADQLYIEYDEGEQTDHYGRHLVYLYADDVNVHEVMLEEGLARVGYIYEQQRYLSEFKEKEQYAKDNLLGIWSMPGYVNEGGEGFNSGEKESAEDNSNSEVVVPSGDGSYNFANCTELKMEFPDGVPSDHAAYQSKMDRDKDNWACE